MNTTYALDNGHTVASEHHSALADLLDPISIARIDQLAQRRGKPWRSGLEIGPGAGSMTQWLAGRVDRLVAADLDPTLLPHHPTVAPVAIDLTDGQPLAPQLGDGFDLIFSRMTFQHLPNRDELVGQLAELLAPGGVLLIEDWATQPTSETTVCCASSPEDVALFLRVRAAIGEVFDAAGADRGWARRTFAVMRTAGLRQVQTRTFGEYWAGGSPGMRLTGTVIAQLETRLLQAGITSQQLERVRQLLADPEFVIEGHPLYSTSGVRGPA